MNVRTFPAGLQRMFGFFSLLALAGCAGVPPGRIVTDRMEYGQVIAESWKRQTLLNVVRMRYADAPVFLDVSSVINSYSMGGNVGGTASLPSHTDPNVFGLSTQQTWSNTPTVTYQPLLGDRFTRSLLQPVPPASIFQLLQAGWSPEVVFRTVVASINRLRNDSLGAAADPGFRELVDALSRIQQTGNLGIRVEPRKEGSAIIFVLRQGGANPQPLEDGRLVRELLELDEGTGEFSVVYGLVQRNGREVAVLSRSMLEIILDLGFGIELPAGHASAGVALPGRRQAGDAQSTPLVRIRSGTAAPEDAYTAVPYKGYWYWIDDADVASKGVFTFLLILFSLAETGQSTAAPMVTVPSR